MPKSLDPLPPEPLFQNIDAQGEMNLVAALLTLKTPDEVRRFLYDICTPKEIGDLADRLSIARMLDEGKLSYRDINAKTGISVTTIGRVARFLQQENFKGYRIALDRLKDKARKG